MTLGSPLYRQFFPPLPLADKSRDFVSCAQLHLSLPFTGARKSLFSTKGGFKNHQNPQVEVAKQLHDGS